MGPFIGFLVLLGPLVFVVLWLPLCLWIARKVAKRFTGGGARWASGVAAFLVVFILPFADGIAGQIYFNHLCSTEAGVKVYQMVELPAEYWDGEGKPKFYDEKNGNLRLPPDSVKWVSRTEKYPLNLEKNISEMKEINTGKILNERVLFTYWGGWVARSFSPHNTATSCGSDVKAYTSYVMQIFKPATSTR